MTTNNIPEEHYQKYKEEVLQFNDYPMTFVVLADEEDEDGEDVVYDATDCILMAERVKSEGY
jgi:predicted transcriptional regulator